MSAVVTYPSLGRGAWPTSGAGGTLRSDGTLPGKYYRSVAKTSTLPAVGLEGARAERDTLEISIDSYAVWRAATAIQVELRERGFTGPEGKSLGTDGIWGPATDFAVKAFQSKNGLLADGIFGPVSAKAMYVPVVNRVADQIDSEHPDLATIVRGTINLESGWDPAAVGRTTPVDLGLGQINGPAHPKLSANDRLNPKVALPYIARLIQSNLEAFDYNVRYAIAAYNLGQGGCRTWISQGCPETFRTARPQEYIDKILAGAA